MKKFLLHTFLFLSALVAGVVALFVMPVDKEYAYGFLFKGGCQGRSPWIYKQLFKDTGAIDIAFIGTSHTMNALNDQWIEDTIRAATGKNIRCCNLSYCGFGRDLDYIITRDLLQNKMVKTLVVEVREKEHEFGHLYFPYIAGSADLLTAPGYYNRSYLPNIYKSFLFRLQYLREKITREDEKRKVEIAHSRYGVSINYGHIESAELDSAKSRAALRKKNEIQAIQTAVTLPAMYYVEQLSSLAKLHHVSLVFIYLPAYSGQASIQEIQEKYGKWGTVVFCPAVYQNKSMWADDEHLNSSAAALVSGTLAKSLLSI